MTAPFLKLIKQYGDDDKWAELLNQLGSYQKKHHPGHTWRLPREALALPPLVINAPNYEEEQAMELDREIRQPPHSPRRVE